MIVYIILHYRTIDDTLACIKSIKRNNLKSKIVVVDNNSGISEHIKLLKEMNIDFIVSDRNLGFANGNNLGCEYAIKTYSPEFLCVINSDTIIEQNNFEIKIEELYNKFNFDVLGPKILPENLDSCNPFYAYENYDEINNAIKKAKRDKLIYSIPLIRSLYDVVKSIKASIIKRAPLQNGKEELLGVPLHGCALVFSKKYYNKYKKVFYDGTFMFHEEEFLTYRMRRDNLCFVYSPELEIVHNEGRAQNLKFKKNYQKELFRCKWIIDSLEKLKQIKKENKAI